VRPVRPVHLTHRKRNKLFADVYSGMLGSGSTLLLARLWADAVAGALGDGWNDWAYRLGACRVRVFFRIPACALRLTVCAGFPSRVDALLGAMAYVLWYRTCWWGGIRGFSNYALGYQKNRCKGAMQRSYAKKPDAKTRAVNEEREL